MLRPALRGQLRGSEALLTGWSRTVPSVPHPQLTRPLVIAIARSIADSGQGECAIACLVAFVGLLRVGELVRITAAEVYLPRRSRRGGASRASQQSASSSSHPSLRRSSSSFIRIADAETGTNQTAEIRNRDIISLLRQLMSARHPSGRPFRLRLFVPLHRRPPTSARCCVRCVWRSTSTHTASHITRCITAAPHMPTCTWTSPSSTCCTVDDGSPTRVLACTCSRARRRSSAHGCQSERRAMYTDCSHIGLRTWKLTASLPITSRSSDVPQSPSVFRRCPTCFHP